MCPLLNTKSKLMELSLTPLFQRGVSGRVIQLSPYLFLLGAEGFSALLTKAEEDGLVAGVKICRDAPSISHLLFADDSLILIRAKGEDAT